MREKNKVLVSEDHAVGPPMVITRGEATEITVLNHLKSPTTIHWHGLELESYYDGVVGGGVADQVTPAIAPGGSFVARFTPNRAGTFIYHTHAADPNQLSGGIYGALIVLEPGQSFDAEHDKLLVIGTRDTFFDAKRITINGNGAAPSDDARPGHYLPAAADQYRAKSARELPDRCQGEARRLARPGEIRRRSTAVNGAFPVMRSCISRPVKRTTFRSALIRPARFLLRSRMRPAMRSCSRRS